MPIALGAVPKGARPGIEKRRAERAYVGFKIQISAPNPVNSGHIVGPAILRDLSLSGACATTRHQLRPGQQIEVTIPTEGCPPELQLPPRITGRAEVRRITPRNGQSQRVAMSFLPPLSQNMEFAFYMAYLLGRQSEQ